MDRGRVDQLGVTTMLAGAAVIGLLGRDERWLAKVVTTPELLNAPHSTGMTPLFVACYTLWFTAVEMLLDAGADPASGFEGLDMARLDWQEPPVVWVRAPKEFKRIHALLMQVSGARSRMTA